MPKIKTKREPQKGLKRLLQEKLKERRLLQVIF